MQRPCQRGCELCCPFHFLLPEAPVYFQERAAGGAISFSGRIPVAEKRLEGQASLPDSVAPTLTAVSDPSPHSQVPSERLTGHQATPSLTLEEDGVGWGHLLSNRNHSLWPSAEVRSAPSPAQNPQHRRITFVTRSNPFVWCSSSSHSYRQPSVHGVHPWPGPGGLIAPHRPQGSPFIHPFSKCARAKCQKCSHRQGKARPLGASHPVDDRH